MAQSNNCDNYGVYDEHVPAHTKQAPSLYKTSAFGGFCICDDRIFWEHRIGTIRGPNKSACSRKSSNATSNEPHREYIVIVVVVVHTPCICLYK